MRTQYVVVDAGLTLIELELLAGTGEEVFDGEPTYHWYDSVAEPAPTTVSCEELPELIVEGVACGCVWTEAEVQEPTVTVTPWLSALPQPFEIRTQYVVVDAGLTLIELELLAGTGEDVFDGEPTYHWYDSVAEPAPTTVSCEELPELMLVGEACGCV
jgi:hypothetical protein